MKTRMDYTCPLELTHDIISREMETCYIVAIRQRGNIIIKFAEQYSRYWAKNDVTTFR